EVAALMQAATDRFGRIDVLVNNAGITRDNLLMRMSEADFDAVVDTNLKGTFLCMKAVSRIMMKQRYGRIINMSSVVALRGNPGQMNYVASKAGVIGMTKTMAKELASRGITANAIAPGFIETAMTAALTDTQRADMVTTIPMARPGKPEDVAAAVAFLADEASGYITGQVLCVDGGRAV
ncbi:MAG: SDR family oxidoreductase, partial [Eubacterium sp.]